MHKIMNFLVVSTGRTGTKWLAQLLNRSRYWTVLCEPRGYRGDSFEKAGYAYNNDFYGEVNGALLKDYEKFDCKKAIIARDPDELLLSWANRYDIDKLREKMRVFEESQKLLESYGGTVIDFRKMTTNLDYLHKIAAYLHVHDVEFTEHDLRPVNTTKVKTYEELKDLPKHIIELWKSLDIHTLTPNL